MDKPQTKPRTRRRSKARQKKEEERTEEPPRTREELLVLLQIERKKNERLRVELEKLLAMDCT